MTDLSEIFVDANQFVNIFKLTETRQRQLLQTLARHKDHIFVTRQIVDEVNRNKLSAVMDCIRSTKKRCELPHELISRVSRTGDQLRADASSLSEAARKIEERLDQATSSYLGAVSRSEDDVSIALAPVFARARFPSQEQIGRAMSRKERGTPPGKPGDPLGDQLNWEQFLAHALGRPRLWIISRDSDYFSTLEGKSYLNPVLFEELRTTCKKPPDVYCFDNLVAGLKHFIESTGADRSAMPTGEDASKLEAEFVANYLCGRIHATCLETGETIPLMYVDGAWRGHDLTLVLHRDAVIVNGCRYPVQSFVPLNTHFCHNGKQHCLTL